MPAPIPSAVLGLLPYQFHQVAIYCPSGVKEAVDLYSGMGYDNWIFDDATLRGYYQSEARKTMGLPVEYSETKAHMAFNYDIMPMELEFLHYEGDQHRWAHIDADEEPFITHMSTYVEDVLDATQNLTDHFGFPPFHRFITADNTNPGVKGKKRFIESIFGTHHLIGYDLKLIEKVPWNFRDSDWLDAEFVPQTA